jgi:uroporphyrin-3 C-methyltransferase
VISPSSPPPSRTAWLVAALLALLALLAIGLAWDARQRLRTMEKELVRRAQESQAQAAEARVLARQPTPPCSARRSRNCSIR